MRYFVAVLMLLFAAGMSSCSEKAEVNRLAYQDMALYIEAEFSLDGDGAPLILELAAPEYDEEGRMLARNAKITVGEDSLLSGVGFEAVGGEYFVLAGDLRVPIAEADTVSGISDIISLFCIDGGSYYSSKKCDNGHGECEISVYKSGDDSVEVHTDKSSGMPLKITARASGREMTADIKTVRNA